MENINHTAVSGARTSPEEAQRSSQMSSVTLSCPSILTEEDERLMESILPSPRSEQTEQQAAARSPLNIIPRIDTAKIQPLVVSFWERAGTTDLTKRESRETLAEMFLEVIATISNLILEAFRNMVLEGRVQEDPLLVSEEAVRKAVCPSLWDSFIAALGSTHQSMNALFKVVSEEVTSYVNSVLCCSKVKGERLVVPKESSYRPPKDKLKVMVCHARTMLRAVKEKVRLCSGSSVPAEGQEEETPSSTKRESIRQKLRSCFSSQKHEEELDIITAPTEIKTSSPKQVSAVAVNKTSAPIMSTETVQEEEEKAPIRRNRRLRQTLGRCIPCGGRSEQQKASDGAESDVEQSSTRVIKSSGSKSLTSGSAGSRRSVLQMNTDPSRTYNIKAATAEVEEILLAEAMELNREESQSLRYDARQTASDIVNSITDESESGTFLVTPEQDGICTIHSPALTGVESKIKYFFTMCYVKDTLHSLLSRLRCSPCVRPAVSLEEVIEKASPVLQELVQEEDDVPQSHPGKSIQQSECLTDIITSMSPALSQPQFRTRIRMEVEVFMDLTSMWMHRQTQLPDRISPVQRALKKIRKVFFKMSSPPPARQSAQPTYIEEPVPLLSQPINQQCVGPSEVPLFHQASQAHQEHAGPSEVPLFHQPPQAHQEHVWPLDCSLYLDSDSDSDTPPEGRGLAPDGPMPMSNSLGPLPGLWSRKDCNILVYEVASRIYQTKNPKQCFYMSDYLLEGLHGRVSQWDVQVKPSLRSCKEVASAVYKDLCKGQEKVHVQHAACFQEDYPDVVLDAIHRNLTAPKKKRRTLGSFLRSMCSAICRR